MPADQNQGTYRELVSCYNLVAVHVAGNLYYTGHGLQEGMGGEPVVTGIPVVSDEVCYMGEEITTMLTIVSCNNYLLNQLEAVIAAHNMQHQGISDSPAGVCILHSRQ